MMIAVLALLILTVIATVAFKPRPILPDRDDLMIGYIREITNDGGTKYIENYNKVAKKSIGFPRNQ